jgi:hypothetical protein
MPSGKKPSPKAIKTGKGPVTKHLKKGTVTIVFQKWPGKDPLSRIKGLMGRVNLDPAEPIAGGEVEIPAEPGLLQLVNPANEQEVWGTYSVLGEKQLPELDPPWKWSGYKAKWCLLGARIRLAHLGYSSGCTKDMPSDGMAFERAVLNFEADERLVPNGLTERIDMKEVEAAAEEYKQGAKSENWLKPGYPRPERISPETLERLDQRFRSYVGETKPTPDGAPLSKDQGGTGPNAGQNGLWTLGIYRRHALVLVRFDRAHMEHSDEGGSPACGPKPYLDDRGYRTFKGVRGPVVTTVQKSGWHEIKVRLVRENLSVDAPLFLKSDRKWVARVDDQPLSGEEEHEVTITITSAEKPDPDWKKRGPRALIRVHLGAPDGPEIHQLMVRVLRPIDLNLAVTNVDGALAGENVLGCVRRLNLVYQAAGLRFHLTNVWKVNPNLKKHAVGADQLKRMAHHPQAINVYVLPNDPGLAGLGLAGASGYSNRADVYGTNGVFLPARLFEATVPRVLQHEIAHVLHLNHADPDEDEDRRLTSWTLRRAMFFLAEYGVWNIIPKWQTDGEVSRRDRLPGQQLTLKNLAVFKDDDVHDDEVAVLRTCAGRKGAKLVQAHMGCPAGTLCKHLEGPYDMQHWWNGTRLEWPKVPEDPEEEKGFWAGLFETLGITD